MTDEKIERPVPSQGNSMWGSDAVAETLRSLEIPYVALNPGASFRGLHDSLVNRLGNTAPQMLLCLHEESAVAIAHGYAKVTGVPMAAIAHSNVGLMHASMSIFNAWCDRVPILLIGATGPVQADKRRPWIDWIHTARDQGALIRGYTKWDDQPASVPAAMESLMRAWQIARTPPAGPTYVCLDVGLQESELSEMPTLFDPSKYPTPGTGTLLDEEARSIVERLAAAERPLILMGRTSRSEKGWADRVRLAEATGARVLTDTKISGAFPTNHPLYAAHGAMTPNDAALAFVAQADFILDLDWVDLGGTLKTALGDRQASATVIRISPDQYVHNGTNMEYQALPPVDEYFTVTPDAAVAAMARVLEAGSARSRDGTAWPDAKPLAWPALYSSSDDEQLQVSDIALALKAAVGDQKTCLIRHPFAWAGHFWQVTHPLDLLGYDGGGGVGSGPGMSVGAALALKGTDRLPVSVVGDGDFLMGVTALWTAAHYEIPLLLIVANNNSFYNDEIHQERMAKQRGRPTENKWIGQHIKDPDIDIAGMARAQGCVGIGPIVKRTLLDEAVRRGVDQVREGKIVVIDVRVMRGYGGAMPKTVLRESE